MAVALKERKKQFHELIRRHLAELGFRKSGENYIVQLTPDIVGLLFPMAVARRGPEGTTLEIFCNVAVRHERLQRLLEELGAWPKQRRIFPSIVVHIGYLMPENTYTPWLFDPGADMTEGALDFVDCVERYALPYMHAHASLEAIAEEIFSKPGNPYYSFYRPVMLYLLGKHDEALRSLERFRQERPDDEEYRRFADRLAALIRDARHAQG